MSSILETVGYLDTNSDFSSIFWKVDPTNISQKDIILQIAEPVHTHNASLSPNGQHIVFETNTINSQRQTWRFNLLTQELFSLPFSPTIYQWHPSEPIIAYLVSNENNFYSAIETYHIETSEKRIIIETLGLDFNSAIGLIGWSQEGEGIYYQTNGSETWYAPHDNLESHTMLFNNSHDIDLSLDGSVFQFYIANERNLAYFIPTPNQGFLETNAFNQQISQQTLFSPIPVGFASVWASNAAELIYTCWQTCGVDVSSTNSPLLRHNFVSNKMDTIGTIPEVDSWKFLSISPDYTWLILDKVPHEGAGDFVLHVPSEIMFYSYPTERQHFSHFLGWIIEQN